MAFSHLGLSAKVLSAIETAGYKTPTPIQDQAIPHVLARRDVLGIAQTGTGKTAAFVLPMLTMLEQGRARARMPRTLILEPTRELAAQVADHFEKYGKNHKLNVALIIGGVSFDDQDAKLLRGVDVLIATPGRLLDHFERGRHWPRPKSVMKLKDALRAKTPRNRGQSLAVIIDDVNRTTRGWFQYFQHSPRRTFPHLDAWVRMRLRSILRRRHRQSGRGRGRDHQRWPNAYFAALGLYRLTTAHAAACQSVRR